VTFKDVIMARWRPSSNQHGVRPGHTRYNFTAGGKGRRVRKQVEIRNGTVHVEFSRWAASLEDKTVSGRFFDLFEVYLDEFSKVRKTRHQYLTEVTLVRTRLPRFFRSAMISENIMVSDFKASHLEKYIKWRLVNGDRKPTVSPKTVNLELSTIQSFKTWCIMREYRKPPNPVKGRYLKVANERHIDLTGKQISQLLDIAEWSGSIEFYTFVMLGIYTGMRVREILSLQWKVMDLENRKIYLSQQVTKSKRSRIVDMPPSLVQHLLTLPCSPEDKVVGMSYTVIRRRWKKLLEALPFKETLTVDRLTRHDMRHIHGQALRHAGAELDFVSTQLGHSNPKITKDRYAQTGSKKSREKIDLIDEYIPDRTK
jgi:integrase